MRSIWKGAITFGLVNVPVKVYSATEDHNLPLHQVHDADGGRIRYQRRCEICGKIVDYGDIDKAYDDGERTVVLTADDLATLPSERSKEIDVVEFVPTEQIDPIMFDRSYFLEPDGSSPKAYVLLRRTLEETDRTAVVLFSLRQKTRLAALRVRGDVLMLQTLLWDDEVREARFPSLDKAVRIGPKELQMSRSLVDSFAADFAPEQFSDEYQEQLRALVEAKLDEGEALSTEETFGGPDEDSGGEVLSLMDALKRSAEANRAKRSAGSSA
jgi:DNA end-binding protein Ku